MVERHGVAAIGVGGLARQFDGAAGVVGGQRFARFGDQAPRLVVAAAQARELRFRGVGAVQAQQRLRRQVRRRRIGVARRLDRLLVGARLEQALDLRLLALGGHIYGQAGKNPHGQGRDNGEKRPVSCAH